MTAIVTAIVTAARTRARLGAVALLLLAAFALACEGSARVTAPGEDLIVVHGVLNPSLDTQSVLVERLQSGRDVIDTVTFDPSSPIRTGFGTPLSGASVVVADARGDSAVGVEARPAGTSTGVYRFVAPGGAIVPGGRYTLRVTAPDGRVVTGATMVPPANAIVMDTGAVNMSTTFDRGGPPLALSWPAASGTAEYLVRVDHPFLAYVALITDTATALPGTLVGFETGPAFLPGFDQTVTVSAVDSNLFDYMRPMRNQYLNARNHLRGGAGVFGSVALLVRRPLTVTAAYRDPFDGAYARDTTAAAPPPASVAPGGFTLTVYTAAGDAKFASGRTTDTTAGAAGGATTAAPRGVVAVLRMIGATDSVQVVVLRAWSGSDTAAVLLGHRDGTALRLVARAGGSTPAGPAGAGVPVTYRKVTGP